MSTSRGLSGLVSDTAVYGMARVLASAVGLLLLPVYARYFSVAEYGIIENLNILSYATATVFGLSLPTALTQKYFQATAAPDRQAVMSSAAFATLLLAVMPLVLGWPLFAPLGSWLVRRTPGENTMLIALVAMGCLLSLPFSLVQTGFRVRFERGHYLAASLGAVALTAALSLLFVAVFDLGLTGVFLAPVLGYLPALAYGTWHLRDELSPRSVSAPVAREMARFGSSFVLAALFSLVIKSSDRYFLSTLRPDGLFEVGLYSTAEKLMAPLVLVGFAFGAAWAPFALSASTSPDATTLYRRVFKTYVATTSWLLVALAAIAPYVADVVAPPAYRSSVPYTPGVGIYLALNYLFYIGSLGLMLTGRSTQLGPIVALAAAVNLGLNYVCIPRWGLHGAIVATNTALLLYNLLVFRVGERHRPVGFPLGRGLILYALAYAAGTVAVARPRLAAAAILGQLLAVFLFGFGDVRIAKRLWVR